MYAKRLIPLCSFLFILLLILLLPLPALGQIANGGFESGATGWTLGGGGAAEIVDAAAFTPNLAPSEGSFMVLLSTGPGALGGATGDWDANGTGDMDFATVSTTFTLSGAPASLSFDWAFLTSEAGEAFDFDDYFEVRLDGVLVLGHSVRKPGGVSPHQDTPHYDAVAYAVTTDGPIAGAQFTDGSTGFQSFCLVIPTAGVHTLEFRIADQDDLLFDSGLLIDNVRAPSNCAGTSHRPSQRLQRSGSGLQRQRQ